ncbi:circularly permuted type 2 ATP-grasp protein [Cellulomonas endophytica]|uniref:circularly permuted type 2 ATP-grasp protein n=1 Tax=Cellulomonas endophytica TaxID=2494735 RepID=UPI001F0CA4A5|nr:circularly permuted type 2 ATP-grasp protein [Cellulomonas endophytica]
MTDLLSTVRRAAPADGAGSVVEAVAGTRGGPSRPPTGGAAVPATAAPAGWTGGGTAGSGASHRPDWSWLEDPADAPTPETLDRARRAGARLLAEHGVTYGGDAADGEDAWRLDPEPVIVDEAEWAGLDRALRQRAALLDAVLRDLYGGRRLLHDRLLPPHVVLPHPGFLREVDGLRLPGPRELVLTATDVVRDSAGGWCAVADRTQAPSGAGYAMEDRRVVAQVLAGVYRQASIARLGPFFHALRGALQAAAPAPRGDEEPGTTVLLTSGEASETAFDQAYLASMLGLPLVEGGDLVVRGGRLWLRGLDGLERVDVVLRRVDADWCDPLDLRSGSRLGVPGLVRAVRGGAVSVVNPLGSSVLENPALLRYLPRLARAVLDEDLALPSAPTWWCGDDVGRAHVRAHLDRLILLPTAQGPGVGAVLGWTLSAAQRETLAARIEAEPWAWVAQEPVGPSGPVVDLAAGAATAEEVAGIATAAPGLVTPPPGATAEVRAAVLRTFAVAHEDSYTVMSGGLARLSAGAVVSSALGAAAKDVWVLANPDAARPATQELPVVTEPGAGPGPGARATARSAGPLVEVFADGLHRVGGIAPRTAENLYWFGRYAERAEDQSRVLRALVDRWDDFHRTPWSAGGRALRDLLVALAPDALPDGRADVGPDGLLPAPALRDRLLDPVAAGTVATSVRRTLRAAAAVRDQLPPDAFAPLARVERALRDERQRRRADGSRAALPGGGAGVTAGMRPTLERVLEGVLAVAGLAAESLVRDAGWRFLDAGRRLERAQHLVTTLQRTVVVRRAPAVDDLVLESLLGVHESPMTYRRRQQSDAGVHVVPLLELLLRDRTNPRSLAYGLRRLRDDLGAVPVAGRAPDQRDHLLADVEDLVEELDTGTVAEAVTDGGRRDRLDEALESMRWRLLAVGEEVERVHFTRAAAARALEDPWDAGALRTPGDPAATAGTGGPR